MLDPTDEQILKEGPAKTVAYAIDANGAMPAKEFLETTKGKRAPSKSELAALDRLFGLMAQQGRIANKEHFKKERGKIFGFKKYQARVAAFQIGDVWYLTHGFKKRQDKWPDSELAKAERIRSEHMQRARGKR